MKVLDNIIYEIILYFKLIFNYIIDGYTRAIYFTASGRMEGSFLSVGMKPERGETVSAGYKDRTSRALRMIYL
ncbi:MAG: hypothetical protein A2Y58_01990 [Chloroflexi bacterium RBG_13_51_52]|nr:MAG: hypothetical protein A2Y58_01990 [Chloroflexi bacterium RBG_13_51_52]